MPHPPSLRVVAGLVLLSVLAACQSTSDEVPEGDAASPEVTGPQDLESILEAAQEPAREWDGTAVPVELSVTLDEYRRVVATRVTHLAPDAARLHVVASGADGTTQQQPTLSTLGFQPVPPDAAGEIPRPPDTLVEPSEVAEVAAETLERCAVEGAVEILYSTGAPAGWDGADWTTTPRWTVTVLDEGGAGAVLDAEGEAAEDACIEVS